MALPATTCRRAIRERLQAHFRPDGKALGTMLGQNVPWLASWESLGVVSAMPRPVSWERKDAGARVLQVTNMWPVDVDPPGPAGSPGPRYGIFVKRQVDSLIEAGVRCDVLFVRGFESPLAYAWAAVILFARGFRRRRYRLVHVHAGETALPARFYLTAPMVVSYYGSDLLGIPRKDGSLSLAQAPAPRGAALARAACDPDHHAVARDGVRPPGERPAAEPGDPERDRAGHLLADRSRSRP